ATAGSLATVTPQAKAHDAWRRDSGRCRCRKPPGLLRTGLCGRSAPAALLLAASALLGRLRLGGPPGAGLLLSCSLVLRGPQPQWRTAPSSRATMARARSPWPD